jgi:CRP-like cAMP-binding protein
MATPGQAIRIPFSDFRASFLTSEAIRTRVLEMLQQQTLTVSQIAVCNRYHETEARLARLILTIADRLQNETLRLTHESLARLVGAQRTTVTMVGGALHRNKLIRYERGEVTILNRRKLQDAACDCYRVIKELYTGLYAGSAPVLDIT